MKRTLGRWIGALCGAGVLTTALVASAEWDKLTDMLTFSGAQCTFSNAGDTDGQHRTPPKLQNTTSGTRNAICPISRDRRVPGFVGTSILTSSSVPPTGCKTRIRNWSDGTTQALDYTSTINLNGNQQVLFNFGANGYTIGGNSSLAITCDLPPNASILTYTYDAVAYYLEFGE